MNIITNTGPSIRNGWQSAWHKFAPRLLAEVEKFTGTVEQRLVIIRIKQMIQSRNHSAPQLTAVDNKIKDLLARSQGDSQCDEEHRYALLAAWAAIQALLTAENYFAVLAVEYTVECVACGWSAYARGCSAEKIARRKRAELSESLTQLLAALILAPAVTAINTKIGKLKSPHSTPTPLPAIVKPAGAIMVVAGGAE